MLLVWPLHVCVGIVQLTGCCWLPFRGAPGLSGTCLSPGQPLWFSHCSGKSQVAQQKELQSCIVGQALWAGCPGWWQERTYSIFPKYLESKGLVRHSCAESTVAGGFNCDTSNAHNAVSICASEQNTVLWAHNVLVLLSSTGMFSPAFLVNVLCRRSTAGAQAGRKTI